MELPRGPGRITVHPAVVSAHNMQFILHAMLDSGRAVFQRWQCDRKAAKLGALAPKLIAVPSVEVAEDGDALG